MVALLVRGRRVESLIKVQEPGGVNRQKKKQNPRMTVVYDTEEGAHVTPHEEAG